MGGLNWFCRGKTDCDGGKESDVAAICRCTYTGRPLGRAESIAELKQKTATGSGFLEGGRELRGVLVELCLQAR
jgi:hypothetical protein